MRLAHLNIESLRNISAQVLSLHPKLNIFVGENGSGKSSLLESIYLLAFARSFRTRSPAQLIQHGAELTRVVANLVDDTEGASGEASLKPMTLGIEKKHDNSTSMRLDGEKLKSIADVARVFPLQLLNTQTYQLLQAAPAERRKMLNWAVFHVKPSFAQRWQQFSRLLKHRNALLRQGCSQSELSVWDRDFIAASEDIFLLQQQVFNDWQQRFEAMIQPFTALPLQLRFKTGLPAGKKLEDCLPTAYERETVLGYSRYGAHRSDVALVIDKTPARYFLSLGQQKLAAVAMSCSLIQLVSEHLGQPVHYLVDDLAADLDETVVKHVMQLLLQQNTQLFLTCTSQSLVLPNMPLPDCSMFHVKHGCFSPADLIEAV